ncbi:hypothetical protein PZN02_000473 [Sinorhizobium garamanticum]|uniref:Transposase n=1 Tax=Sinorhizobium garamanticum TaxID=680247 RepID=A0ABY8DAV7_9HYPH|nr:hypothetical protein [Sinorhizobium garamanticum]WEX88023.1 hypothetical protein PZN02_000473 [Sinorhizobium garamanticum]
MMNTARLAAENLFRPAAPEGSNATKLQKIRARQILRMRERRPVERQQRLEKRMSRSRDTLFASKERIHDV